MSRLLITFVPISNLETTDPKKKVGDNLFLVRLHPDVLHRVTQMFYTNSPGRALLLHPDVLHCFTRMCLTDSPARPIPIQPDVLHCFPQMC